MTGEELSKLRQQESELTYFTSQEKNEIDQNPEQTIFIHYQNEKMDKSKEFLRNYYQ